MPEKNFVLQFRNTNKVTEYIHKYIHLISNANDKISIYYVFNCLRDVTCSNIKQSMFGIFLNVRQLSKCIDVHA